MSEWHDRGVSVRRLIQMLETCNPNAEVRAWYDGNHRLAVQRIADHGETVSLCDNDDWTFALKEKP